MRKNSPIHWHPPSDLPGFWSLTRHEDIRSVYGNPKLFSSAHGVLLRPLKYGEDPAGGLTLALTDPPRHKQLRSIMSKWFSGSYAKSLENVIRNKIKNLLTKGLEEGDFDFTQDIAFRLTLFVTCYILGVPERDHDDVFHWAHQSFAAGKSLAAHNQFMIYFGNVMEARLNKPSDDLASTIIQGICVDKPIAEDEILLNFENLVGATENAGLSIASGILAFLHNPESWNLLVENRELMATAIEEMLRWASSATHSMRTVTEVVEINNQVLNPGERVVLWIPSANRDESFFDLPYEFNITRRPNHHLAFGYGEHFCIGNAIARIQMRILLTELLNMEYFLELSGEPVPLRSIHVNGPIRLPVRFAYK